MGDFAAESLLSGLDHRFIFRLGIVGGESAGDPLFHLEPENAIDMFRGSAVGDSDGQKGVLGRKGQTASSMCLS